MIFKESNDYPSKKVTFKSNITLPHTPTPSFPFLTTEKEDRESKNTEKPET